MIDDILLLEWDPIGVKDIARDEYQSYLPTIFKMQKANSNRDEIAEQLLKFENENMGLNGTIAKCLKIADKIISIDKTIV